MNLDELQSKIESLETELSEIKRELQQQEVKTGRWKPDLGENYFYIENEECVYETYWTNDTVDNMRFAIGNVFETHEKAEFQVEKLKVVAELKEYASDFVKNESNYFIYWSYSAEKISYSAEKISFNCWDTAQQNELYFKSKEIAQQAVDAVGEERVKKYYLEVAE